MISEMEAHLGIQVGETTPDGEVSLMAARCIGACGIAPAVVFDGVVAGKQTSQTLQAKLDSWKQ
jgi:bidirectional [NiFe] hydrogenase diaphorase subunit